MTDTTTQIDPAGDTGDEAKKARADAVHVLARALWREGLVAAPTAGDAEPAAGGDRAGWKDQRKEYVKLATRLVKRLDRQGATLAAAPDKEADGEADAD